jgi:crotonobetainyl-CoA:carnitine CoA-transferase CaiB-like acyl-CoA transferase
MYKPLEGIKIVDFTLAGAGPSCTKLLTEYGADDIWIEPLTGSSTRTVHKFDFYTNGKRDITLNLKSSEGLEVMYRLIKKADVFVSNYRPKAVQKLGLGYEKLKELNPRLIYATLTGFGEEGPAANDPGYDPVAFWARGGMLLDFAEKGSLVVPPIAVGDIASGQALAGGICAALYQREKTGKGCRVFTSLLAMAAYLNHDAVVETQYGEEYPKSRLAPRRSLLNTYRCGDGKWITVSVAQDFDRYFGNLMKAVGRGDLAGDPRWTCMEDTMYEKAPELVAILDEAFAKMTQAEAIAALESIDAPVSKVQSTAEMMKDPQVLKTTMCLRLKPSTVKTW